MTRHLIRTLAFLWLVTHAGCGEERARPAPLLGPDELAPKIQLQALVAGGTTTQATVEGTGFVARVIGSSLPAPAELLLTASSDSDEKAFFIDRLPVGSPELSADFTIRAGVGRLTGASGITLRVLLVPDAGGDAVTDSLRVRLR